MLFQKSENDRREKRRRKRVDCFQSWVNDTLTVAVSSPHNLCDHENVIGFNGINSSFNRAANFST